MISIKHNIPFLCHIDHYENTMKDGKMSKKCQLAGVALGLLLVSPVISQSAEDERELVPFPEKMQDHMMSNMRDHLRSLEDILSALANGDVDKAGEIAESRIGMSSLGIHGAAQIAKFMPEPMQAMGTELHHAASKFVIAVQNADMEPNEQFQKAIFGALSDISATCNACHSAYRIR